MITVKKPNAFVLVSTNHGMMIVNKHDYRDYKQNGKNVRNGVGYQLLETSSYEQEEVDFAIGLLAARRRHHGDEVVAVDCGANIGILSIEWARFMTGWGRVISFEAQAKLFYAFAGNIVLNNCLNIDAYHAAIGNKTGVMAIPEPNYLVPSSYGALDLEERPNNMDIGQKIDYTKTIDVDLKTIDSLALERVDFIKIDVQGGELSVLKGAARTLSSTLGVEAEVEFIPMYDEQPLFGEISEFLTKYDFEFIDFTTIGRWERQSFNGSGQAVYGDALFLKSPETVLRNHRTIEQLSNYLKILLVYYRFDLIDFVIYKLSDEERNTFYSFCENIIPIRIRFNMACRCSLWSSRIMRLFGLNYRSQLIY